MLFLNKKSMILIAGSFAISITLFLCFTILITFMNHALSLLKPYAPDLTVEGNEPHISLPHSLKEEIEQLPGTEKVYGRMFCTDIPANDKKGSNRATLVSYDEPQFSWASDVLISGDIENVQNGNGVLVDYGYSQEFHWEIGDIITLDINGTTHEVITLIELSDPNFTLKGDIFGEAPAMVSTKLNSLADDESNYSILLSHRPELFESYAHYNIDLVLSGHAHGGQFRLPFIGGLIAPDQGIFPKYDAGLFTNGSTNMIVSRGLGNSIIPIRFNNRPEVIVIELLNTDL